MRGRRVQLLYRTVRRQPEQLHAAARRAVQGWQVLRQEGHTRRRQRADLRPGAVLVPAQLRVPDDGRLLEQRRIERRPTGTEAARPCTADQRRSAGRQPTRGRCSTATSASVQSRTSDLQQRARHPAVPQPDTSTLRQGAVTLRATAAEHAATSATWSINQAQWKFIAPARWKVRHRSIAATDSGTSGNWTWGVSAQRARQRGPVGASAATSEVGNARRARRWARGTAQQRHHLDWPGP